MITLPADAKRIDIQSIASESRDAASRSSVHRISLWRLNIPEFAYDTQNGWVDPARDELAGGSREWYAVQHWAAVHADGTVSAGIILVDNPIVAFGEVVRGAWPREFVPKSATILSWLMSNYWSTNFKSSQGGEFTFRYALVSRGQFEPAELTREWMGADDAA